MVLQEKDTLGRTFAHCAASMPMAHDSHARSIVSELLNEAAGVLLQPDNTGSTPMHHAATAGNIQLLELLLHKMSPEQLSEGINAANSKGLTPLLCAAMSGKPVAVQLLLRHGANARSADAAGRNALHIALLAAAQSGAGNGSVADIAECVLAHIAANEQVTGSAGAQLSDENAEVQLSAAQALIMAQDASCRDSLQLARDMQETDTVRIFCKHLGGQHSHGHISSVTEAAVQPAQVSWAELSHRPKLIARLVLHAVECGLTELARQLVAQHDISPTSLAGPVLHAACQRGNFQLVNYILQSVLWAAEGAERPHPEIAEPVLRSSMPAAVAELLCSRDAAGWQPLHCAVCSGSWRTVHLLLQSWAASDCDIQHAAPAAPSSAPASASAAPTSSPAAAATVAQAGAPGALPCQPISALHLAGYLGDMRIVWLLLVSLYNISAGGPHGRNFLHYVSMGPLQGCEPWLFSTRPRDVLRMIPPAATQSRGCCTHTRDRAHLPFSQLGELAVRLGVPAVADDTGAHPHHYAAASGNAALYELLSKRSGVALCSQVDAHKRTVLHYMCAGGGGHMAVHATVLMQRKQALGSAEDAQGRTPLHYAAQVHNRVCLCRGRPIAPACLTTCHVLVHLL